MSILDKRIPVQRRSRSRHGWRAVGTTAAPPMIEKLSIIGPTAHFYGYGYLKEGSGIWYCNVTEYNAPCQSCDA